MSPAITATNVSKRYRIGVLENAHDTLAATLAGFVSGPLRNLRRLRRLSRFDDVGQNPEDTIWALQDVSFEVEEGEVLGVVGPNGAGKSTLLKILSRITEPTNGRVVVLGRVASLLEVGTGFHPELTGRDNVYLNGTILGMKKKEVDHKFDEIVAFAEVEKFIDTPVKRYSSGMQVRLAFAVAAHLEPEILLVDEVLAVGDAAFQKKCLGVMDGIARGGRTVLFVSHNMTALQNLCSRGILLRAGQVAADGPIGSVIDEYLGSGRSLTGESSWDSPQLAPGDGRARLKAVRTVSEGAVTGEADFSTALTVEVDFWNLEPGSRRVVALQVRNSNNVLVLSSGNIPSASNTPDPWYGRPLPCGEFRTSCVIPGSLLNEGVYYVSVFVQGAFIKDTIIRAEDVLSFALRDSRAMDREFTGEWLGVVRPRLDWQTVQIS